MPSLKLASAKRIIGSITLCLPMLVACAKPSIPVNLHGVNYSGKEFTYYLVDPTNPKNRGGGELIGPYGAGGTNCCFELPRKWRPRLQVEVHLMHWGDKTPEGALPEIPETQVIELAPYPANKVGELWVLRTEDGTVSIVMSDFQPDHPRWPGKVKGWPVPSIEFVRMHWDIDINTAKVFVSTFEELKAELETSPTKRVHEAWEFKLEHRDKSLAKYSGPDDPGFKEELRKNYEEGLVRTKLELIDLQKRRP